MSTQPWDAYLWHGCQESIRQVSKQWTYLSQRKQHRMGTQMRWSRRGKGGGGGLCDAQRLASQPASGTLMTIMSCHTSCRASQQILPLSLPFSNQCYWSVPGVKGQERINKGRVADAAGREDDSRQINDNPRLPLVCYDYSFAINQSTLRD